MVGGDEAEDTERGGRELVLTVVARIAAAFGWLLHLAVFVFDVGWELVPVGLPTVVLATVISFWRGPFRIRAWALVIGYFAPALGVASMLGLAPSPHLLLLAAVVHAGLLLGTRAAAATLAVGTAGVLIVGALHATGVVAVVAPEAIDPTTFGNWVRFTITYVICALTAAFAVAFLLRRLERSLDAKDALLEALRAEQARRAALEEDRLRAQSAMQEAQKLEALGRLAGGVAHDFQNQLAVIRAWVELMRTTDDPSLRAEGITAIDDASRQSAAMTKSLLTVARREAVAPVRLDVAAVAASTLRGLGRVLPSNIRVELALTPMPEVLADESQLGRVIMNLVVNARDAMPAGGCLAVATRHVPAGEAPESAPDRTRSYVELIVTDTGIGMDPEAQRRIFEPFFTTKGANGTGLGLATVLGVAMQYRGYVSVESAEGEGATFRVGLPTAESAEPAPPEPEPIAPPRPPADATTALIVDDQPMVRNAMVRLVESLGFRTLSVACADDALALLDGDDAHIGLVCTESRVPGMAVTDMLEVLRRRWPHLPVLVCAALMDEDLLREQRHHRFAFVMKPFDRDELEAKVREAFAMAGRGVAGATPAPS